MLSRFCLQVLWIQRLCSCSPAKPMIPEDHRVRGIYPVCRSASCTRTTGVSSSQSRATSAFFVLHSAFEQLSPVLSRFYLQPLWIQRFCPCSPAKLMIPEDHRRGVYLHRRPFRATADSPFGQSPSIPSSAAARRSSYASGCSAPRSRFPNCSL